MLFEKQFSTRSETMNRHNRHKRIKVSQTFWMIDKQEKL